MPTLPARRRGPASLAVLAVVALGAGLGWVVLGDRGPSRAASAAPARPTDATTTVRALPAGPVGFGTPKVLWRTPPGAEIDDPVAAVSPTGTAAVMWRSASGFGRGKTFRADYLVATGPDAGHLSRPRPIRAAREAAIATGSAVLLPLPRGGFVACFGEDRRRGTATSGCSFAPPGGGFGPLEVIARDRWDRRPTMSVAVRADGTVVAVTTRLLGKARRAVEVTMLSASGRHSGPRRLGELEGDVLPSLATTVDGTVAVAWANGPAGSIEGDLKPVLRIMAPGSTEFAGPVVFGPDREVTAGVGLVGGAGLLVTYSTGFESDDTEQLVVQRRADGTYAPPRTLPRPGPGYVSGAPLALPDGPPLAIVSSDEQSETDCGNSTGGAVGAGPLVDLPTSASGGSGTRGPVTAERLSAPEQIARSPAAALLADGTVIVAWSDVFGGGDRARLEVAIRRAGSTSFGAAQVLPRDAVFGGQALAAGGDQAILAWTAGRQGRRGSVVVSALRTAAPFAAERPRPSAPGAGCS